MAKVKDIDYLFLSTRVRAMERNLLTRERMNRMLEAHSSEDAAKVLLECGYPEMAPLTLNTIHTVLTAQQKKTFEDLSALVPDRAIIDVFKLKYDYHNVKVLLKAEAMGVTPDHMFMDLGRVPVKELSEKFLASDLRGIPSILQTAIAEARETLGTTGDPQLSDFILDSAYYEDMFQMARQAESPFLEGYVRISIDASNLRSAVRILRMGKSGEFLRHILIPGGNIDTRRVMNAASAGGSLGDLFAVSPLREAAEAGMSAIAGGHLTQFEKLCDNAVTNYLKSAAYVAFGEAPVVAYLAAKESEITAVRIILTGRLADLSAEIIQERLRDSYV